MEKRKMAKKKPETLQKAERDLIKTLMLTAVNARSEEDAISGARKTLYEQNECSCVELEWSPIPDPACPVHGEKEDDEYRHLACDGYPNCDIMPELCSDYGHESQMIGHKD